MTVMQRLTAASSFKVNGFNSETGYTPARTWHKRHANGIKTTVHGNVEAFDKLHI
jgi:hypothetical protein